MTGFFNVVVTEFGQLGPDGGIGSWEGGNRLSDSVLVQFRSELQQIPALSSLTEVAGHREPIKGATPEQRAQAARALAERLKAHVVVHGALNLQGGRTEFVPEFYIASLPGAGELSELTGPNRLGSPIVVPGSDPFTIALITGEGMKARVEALALFTAGLTFLTARSADNAVVTLERATSVRGWADADGKEVAYISLGKAYRARGSEGDTERAIDAYQSAARLSPEYARAYIGLGDTYYEEFLRYGAAPTLDLALAAFQRAKSAAFRPTAAEIEAKIRVNLGSIYTVMAQEGRPDLFTMAEREYREVIEPYERGETDFRHLAAHGYLGLGVIRERRDRDSELARQYYSRAIDAAGANTDVVELARAQLNVLDSQPLLR
jgi:tetratricopeptide (TPR) repeat protein